MTEHHAAGFPQKLCQLRHGVSAVSTVLAAVGFHYPDIAVCCFPGHDRQVGKSLAAQQRGIAIILHVDRLAFGDQLNGVLIPVIGMGMGDDHRVSIQKRLNVNGKLDHRVANISPRRAGKTRISAFWRQHWVD